MKEFDVVVIGAGPSGAVAAARLLQDNLSVLIIEKTEFPRFVIGESLLPQCMDILDKTDLLDCVVEKKFQVKNGVSFYHENKICDFLFDDNYSGGWDYTYQVKRADFDHALIKEVERKGATVHFKSEVTDVTCGANEQVVSYTDMTQQKQTVSCRFVIDASGYGRVLPKLFNLNIPASSIPRGAVFAHVKDDKRTEKAGSNIFVNAFNNNTAWIWSIPFSDGTASVGIVGEDSFVSTISENEGEEFKNLVRSFPGLNGRYSETDFTFEPKTILGYSIAVKQMHGEGFVLCGNSTEFLDPIFSSGVMFALKTGYQAADIVAKQLSGEEVNWDIDYDKVVLHGVEVFRSYVDAWYNGNLHTIFFVEGGNTEFKKQLCSVLAGYVWDMSNPFVKKHKTLLGTLAKVISLEK
tara:strand:+ start:30317 stop:31540 length:1224 start_codon:yes stop_codon:yes gene_type:complete